MITYGINGKPTFIGINNLDNAGDTVLYTVPAYAEAVFESMWICNKGAAAVTVDLWCNTGSAVYLLDDYSIPSKSFVQLKDINRRLAAGNTILARAGTATSLDLSGSVIELHRNTST